MDLISDIKSDGKFGSAIFNNSDITLVNLLRRSIMSEIETYAIEYVIFDINTTSMHDERLASRLGQLVIDNERFEKKNLHLDLERKYNIDVNGEGRFTSDDIKGLPIKFSTPISELQFGERIKCSVIIRKNTGREHVKWRPVGLVAIKEIREGYFISPINVGKEFKIENDETHYIDSVIIKKNTTTITDNFLATSIAQLQINYENPLPDIEEFRIHIDKFGPGYLINYSDKLPVPFKFHFPIAELLVTDEYGKQEIECEIVIRKGQRTNYIRWKSHLFDYSDDTTGFQFEINNIGMMSTEKIFENGLNKIRTAASRTDTPINIFLEFVFLKLFLMKFHIKLHRILNTKINNYYI